MSSLSGRMNIARVNIGFFTGFKKIKQRRISFVLDYLRMILWKISTVISIKHRLLATFNIKKKSILTACMPLSSRHYINVQRELTLSKWQMNKTHLAFLYFLVVIVHTFSSYLKSWSEYMYQISFKNVFWFLC